MKCFRVRLDGDLDRALGFLESEGYVNVAAWVRSLLPAGLTDPITWGAAPRVVPLLETPTMRVPPLRSWSPYKLEDGSRHFKYSGRSLNLAFDGEFRQDGYGIGQEIRDSQFQDLREVSKPTGADLADTLWGGFTLSVLFQPICAGATRTLMWASGTVLRAKTGLLGAVVLFGVVAEVGAQPRRSQWYVGGGAGANWPSRIEQEGHNQDTTCYPNEDCDRLPGGSPPGYRWRYDISGKTGTAYEFFLGRMFSHLRVEFSVTQQKNDINSGFSGISYVDGSPILSIETDLQAQSRASVGDLVGRSLSLNLYYDLPLASNRVTPYLGGGLGIGFFEVTDLFYGSSYSGPGGPYDPPLEFYSGLTNEDLSDTILTKHLYAGVDFGMNERTLLGVKLSHTRMGDFVATGGYQIHPIPGLTSETRFSGMNHWSVILTIKFLLGG